MRALRDFPYWDYEQQRSVVIKAGQEIDTERLTASKVDLEKLTRTKHVAQVETADMPTPRVTVVATRKRGRPKKTAPTS